MDRKKRKLTPEKNDVQKECQGEKITALERKLEHTENKLKLVIAELEQVKEERARDKINFETEKCELESKIDKYTEQCTELQSENKRLQKYIQDLESANINVEEKSEKTLTYNTDLTSQITKVDETNDDALGINSLRDEIILEVFSYLTQNQLGQIASVCRRWNVLIKSPLLWKNVIVKMSPSHRSQTTAAESFINGLPSCVTSVRLNFTESGNWIEPFDFAELCLRLQERCPHLEELILIHCVLSDSLSSVIRICTRLLQDVKNLIFYYSVFRCYRSTDGCFGGISKIEILKLLYCSFDCSHNPPFSKMPNLKQFHLYGKNVDDSGFKYDNSFLNQLQVLNLGFTKINSRIFSTIKNHGHNLKELYLCCALLQDHDLTFTDSAFPHLQTICLRGPYLTCDGVVSLIQSCPSLENVYVRERVAESFAAHPFVVANICESGIVKAIAWNHSHNVDYSHT